MMMMMMVMHNSSKHSSNKQLLNLIKQFCIYLHCGFADAAYSSFVEMKN